MSDPSDTGSVFGAAYAEAYDPLYMDKDYAAECDLIERLVKENSDAPVDTILDLGCGTGGHAIELSSRDYVVTGVDRSAAMIELASAKANAAGRPVTFVASSIQDLDIPLEADLALMMFAVLGYLVDDDDLAAGLRSARRHLRLGGLFIFDCWYWPAVQAQKPSSRSRTIPLADGRLVRTASGTLHPERQACDVDYLIERYDGENLLAMTRERHSMRAFDELTLQAELEPAGFELVRLGGFPNIDVRPAEATWNVTGVARAVD